MSDLRTELLAAFEAELADHLSAMRAALADAEAGRAIDLRDFSRRAHSLKGAARAVELPVTEALAHDAEALLLAIEEGVQPLDAAAIVDLRERIDAIEDSAGAGEAPPEETQVGTAADGRVRVAGQHVELLAQSLHDLSNQVQDGTGLGEGLDALQGELAAIAAQAEREGAAELARRLSRSLAEVERLKREHGRRQWALERTTLELERSAERILLLPVATLFDGHERVVRELAASQGKTALLRIEVSEEEADRRVLQGLRDPVLHLLRNAVSHGIEEPGLRSRAGKEEQGEIHVHSQSSRGRLIVTIRDDGAGLDYRRIEARARSIGLIPAGAPRPNADALAALLFEQGFSTAETVDEVSGRGIGLSVVAEAVRRLHGTVAIRPSASGGTEVTLSVPSALTRQTLLLVEAGGGVYGIPAASVSQLLRIAPGTVERSEGAEMLAVDGKAVPLSALGELLGLAAGTPEGAHHPALVLEDGDRHVALAVDALREVRSAVVGDPTAIAADVPLVYGTALVEDGVALVLSPTGLMALAASRRGGSALGRAESVTAVRQTVLVVDDSITTRTLEKSILEAQGYHVLVSVDGLAALERLRSGMEAVDLVVADVEMPRMDGFALLTAIRNDPALGALPVVMMTSRNSPDDIQRGLDLGANAYVTKQEFDQGALISVIQQLI